MSATDTTERNKKRMKKFKVTKGLLGSILYGYYPSISHKNAGRIIRSIEFKSDVNPKDEEEYLITVEKLAQALQEHYPVVSHRRAKNIISDVENRGECVSD